MDGGKARKLGIPDSIRSRILLIAILAVLMVSVAWGVRESRRAQDALTRAVAAEKAATQAQTEAEPAPGKLRSLRDEAVRRVARRDRKADAERSRQLAEEINGLTRIQERIQSDLYKIKAQTTKPASPPTLDALRDPRNRVREFQTEPDPSSP